MTSTKRPLALLITAVCSIMLAFAIAPQAQAHAADYTEQSILAGGNAWTYRIYSDHAELNKVYVSGTDKTPTHLVIPDYTPAELGSLPITWYDGPGGWHSTDPDIVSVKYNRFITTVAYGAFQYCENLKTVDFGAAPIKTIEGYAFYGAALTSIKFPSTVESIGEEAFISCRLKNLKLPKKLKSIGDNAFQHINQKELVIPDSVKTIGFNAFDVDKLQSLHVGAGIKDLNVKKWMGSASLTNITGCKNVTTISSYPSQLKNIVIFKNVKKIKKDALSLDMIKKPIVIKSKKLTKNGIKKCIYLNNNLKKLSFKIDVGSKKQNKKYLAKYKKFLTKKVVLDWTFDWDLKAVKKLVAA